VTPQRSLFFLLSGGRRLALRKLGDGFQAGDTRLSEPELADQAEQLSPNALLRPVMQDFLLPTAATVAGPGEIAYYAQSQVLYRALLGRMPVTAPRASFTLVDARAAKLMKRYGLSLDAFFGGLEPLREAIAARLVPPALDESIQGTLRAVDAQIARLREPIAAFDPTLAAALATSRSKILYQLNKIRRKTAREAMRRHERAGAESEYLYHLIYPARHLQERFYTILPFLAQHGLDFVGRLYENVRLECPDHLLLVA